MNVHCNGVKPEKLRLKFRGFNFFGKGVSCPNSLSQQQAMETSQRRPLRPSYFSLLVLAWSFISPSQALYFYLDGSSSTPKCFYEELPKDTLVVGEYTSTSTPEQTCHKQWLDRQHNSLADFSLRPLHSPPTHPRNKHLPQQPRPLHNSHSRRSLRQRPPRRKHQRLSHRQIHLQRRRRRRPSHLLYPLGSWRRMVDWRRSAGAGEIDAGYGDWRDERY